MTAATSAATSPATGAPALTGASARTRRAILDAAVTTLADDPTTSLAAIADAAGVGRTTLHRHFPDRQSLVDALVVEAGERLAAVHARAHLTEGTAHEATVRLGAEYLQFDEVFRLVLGGIIPERALFADARPEADLRALLARGHEDGTLDPDLDEDWFQGALWGNLYLASELLRDGRHARHDVATRYLRAVDKAVRA